jgi:glycerol-3-phosphate acyltransferase PlsX
MKIESPRVGLLNIGEEPGKGNEVTQAVYDLLSKSELNFIGNIEGGDIMRGKADVVVTDGYTGNIVLKFAESISGMVSTTLLRHISGNLRGNIGHYLIRPKFRQLLALFDYQEAGGVPLLGVKGNCIIAHGSSGPRAIRNAIREGLYIVKTRVSDHIEEAIGKMERN